RMVFIIYSIFGFSLIDFIMIYLTAKSALRDIPNILKALPDKPASRVRVDLLWGLRRRLLSGIPTTAEVISAIARLHLGGCRSIPLTRVHPIIASLFKCLSLTILLPTEKV